MNEKIIETVNDQVNSGIKKEIEHLTFTKNFRSATAEEWYVFLPSFKEPKTGGAAGKVIVHYNLYGNKEIFINTTIIFDDPALYETSNHAMVYAVSDEIVNRLVGYADTLVAVHAGNNSYQAEYKE